MDMVDYLEGWNPVARDLDEIPGRKVLNDLLEGRLGYCRSDVLEEALQALERRLGHEDFSPSEVRSLVRQAREGHGLNGYADPEFLRPSLELPVSVLVDVVERFGVDVVQNSEVVWLHFPEELRHRMEDDCGYGTLLEWHNMHGVTYQLREGKIVHHTKWQPDYDEDDDWMHWDFNPEGNLPEPHNSFRSYSEPQNKAHLAVMVTDFISVFGTYPNQGESL